MSVPYAEVIGDPIGHSKSPIIHKFWLEKLGIDADYRATHVRPDGLAAYFNDRRADPHWRGCNVTIPHKELALSCVDKSDRSTVDVGATNCVRLIGDELVAANTDIDGIRAAFETSLWRANSVTVIGAGGAARAALAVLREINVLETNIVARNPQRARRLQRMLVRSGGIVTFEEADTCISGCEYLVNASPLGMRGAPSMPAGLIEAIKDMMPHATVFDMVYEPLETQILARARSLGFETVDGLTMLIGQAARAFEIFFDAEPPRQYDTELRELLTR